MKRAYILLIGLLIVIVLAFTYAKSYLSRLESKDLRIKTELGRRQLIDSLQQTFEMMAADRTVNLQHRYDSLARESDVLIYALESQLDLYLNPEYDPVAQDSVLDSIRIESSENSSSDSLKSTADSAASIGDEWKGEIAPREYEVYIAYLERVIDLPKDLTPYEKRVAYREAEKNLAAEYSVTRDDIKIILKKLRKRSITGWNDS